MATRRKLSRRDDDDGGGGSTTKNHHPSNVARGAPTQNPLADARRGGGGRGGSRRQRPGPRMLCRREDAPSSQQPPREEVGSDKAPGWEDEGAFLVQEEAKKKGATDKTKKGRASERRAPSRHGSTSAASADARWESLWHKKTNGGYRLFASYYRNQPVGVVGMVGAEADADLNDNADATTTTTTTAKAESEPHVAPGSREEEVVVVAAGMSRASVRRRRINDRNKQKKRQRIDGDAAAATATTTTATTAADAATGSSLGRENGGGTANDGGDAEDDISTTRVGGADDAAVGWEDHRPAGCTHRAHVASPGTRASTKSQRHEIDSHPLRKALRDVAANRDVEGAVAADFDRFVRALARPLPVSVRVRRGMDPHNETLLREELRTFVEAGVLVPVPGLEAASDGEPAAAASEAPQVYQTPTTTRASASDPKDAAASILTKSNLKASCPELKAFLNEWSLTGGIARQEVGSMLPVVLLQAVGFLPGRTRHVQLAAAGTSTGGIRVLDLCASPGSKTLQAAELLMLLPAKGRSRTVIRANDVHPKRLEALQDAVKRSGIPNVESIIKYSQIDATQFPVPTSESKKYDVVICDVPCSGDGTCRKDHHLLPNWTPRIGNALHATQLHILVRALQLVRIGGVVSYSTCSLNPVENEAVVAAALQQAALMATTTTDTNSNAPPKFELVHLPDFENFVLRPGVSTWRVADSVSLESDESEGDVLRWHETYEDAIKAGMEDAVPSLWPPSPATCHVTQHPDRCRRLLPQDQDTGGFFVALIQRVA